MIINESIDWFSSPSLCLVICCSCTYGFRQLKSYSRQAWLITERITSETVIASQLPVSTSETKEYERKTIPKKKINWYVLCEQLIHLSLVFTVFKICLQISNEKTDTMLIGCFVVENWEEKTRKTNSLLFYLLFLHNKIYLPSLINTTELSGVLGHLSTAFTLTNPNETGVTGKKAYKLFNLFSNAIEDYRVRKGPETLGFLFFSFSVMWRWL